MYTFTCISITLSFIAITRITILVQAKVNAFSLAIIKGFSLFTFWAKLQQGLHFCIDLLYQLLINSISFTKVNSSKDQESSFQQFQENSISHSSLGTKFDTQSYSDQIQKDVQEFCELSVINIKDQKKARQDRMMSRISSRFMYLTSPAFAFGTPNRRREIFTDLCQMLRYQNEFIAIFATMLMTLKIITSKGEDSKGRILSEWSQENKQKFDFPKYIQKQKLKRNCSLRHFNKSHKDWVCCFLVVWHF